MKRSALSTLALALLAACAEGPVAPGLEEAIEVGPQFTQTALATTTVTYDFQDLEPDCSADAFPDEYRGLTFASTPYFSLCEGSSPPLQPGERVMTPTTVRRQTMILPGRAVVVRMQGMWYNEWWNSGRNPPFVEVRDIAGNLVGTMTWSNFPTWVPGVGWRYFLETKGVIGSDITTLTFVADHREFLTTHITVEYADPTERAHCFDGGWEGFGFQNLGLCVRFVETGQDTR